MKKKIIIKPLAREDLIEIWEYISLDNDEKADELLKTLYAKIEFLSEFPRAGVLKNSLTREIRVFSYKSYNIFYFSNDHQIDVVRILHTARDAENMWK